MRCKSVIEQLSAHFDRELSEALSGDIDLHLEQCKSCNAEFRSFEKIRDLIGSTGPSDSAAPPWSAIAERLQVEQYPVTLPMNSIAGASPRSKVKDVRVIVASLAASILIIAWTWQPAEQSSPMAQSGHSHHGASTTTSTAINFQETVLLQREGTGLAMQALSRKYDGREASIEEVVKNVGFKPMVQSSLPNGVKLVSTQLLKMPECNCPEDECTCGPGECNCVACVCERPDGSSFIIAVKCKGQKVNFGDLPVQLVRRGNHDLQVTESDDGLAVTWTDNETRKTAFGLRGFDEIDQLLAMN